LAGLEPVGKSHHVAFESGDFLLGRGQQVRGSGDSFGIPFLLGIVIPFAREKGYRQPETQQSENYS
jgi:hypothetical protein